MDFCPRPSSCCAYDARRISRSAYRTVSLEMTPIRNVFYGRAATKSRVHAPVVGSSVQNEFWELGRLAN